MHPTGRLTLCWRPPRREATERFLKKTCESQRAHIITNEQPSVWFETDEVWEVKGADLTISPVHMCGCNIMDGKGLALRFPRFLRIRFGLHLTAIACRALLASGSPAPTCTQRLGNLTGTSAGTTSL